MPGSSEEDQKASFSLEFEAAESIAQARELAGELNALREKIRGSTDKIRDMSRAQRDLKGKTAEVLAAKKELTSKLDLERDKLSRLKGESLKQGVAYKKLIDAQKKATEAAKQAKLDDQKKKQEALSKAISAAGGPVETWSGRLDKARTILSGGAGLTFLLAGATAAIAALTIATIAGAASFARWVIGMADANRNLRIMDEAVAGSVTNGKNLGDQIDLIARKLPTSRAEAHAMGDELYRTLANTRFNGEGIIDAFGAIGTASAAMGDKVSGVFQEMIQRSKLWGMAGTNAFELQGTGVKIQSLAANVSKLTKVPIQDALAALNENRVEANTFAKALRKTIEERYGDVNAKKLLSVDVQLQKFQDHLQQLAGSAVLEPLLKGLDRLLSQFDEATPAGNALKGMISEFGTMLGSIDPGDLVSGLKEMVIWTQKAWLNARELYGSWQDFQGSTTFTLLKVGLESVAIAIGTVAVAAGVVSAALLALPVAIGALSYAIVKPIADAVLALKNYSWSDIGKMMVEGIGSGIVSMGGWLGRKMLGLAGAAKDAFTGKQGIDAHSPSKWFETKGVDSVTGYARGVQKAAPDAADAVQAMGREAGDESEAPAPRARARAALALGAPGGGQTVVNLEVNINVDASGRDNPKEIAAAIAAPNVLDELTHVIQRAARAAGIAVQTPVAT